MVHRVERAWNWLNKTWYVQMGILFVNLHLKAVILAINASVIYKQEILSLISWYFCQEILELYDNRK